MCIRDSYGDNPNRLQHYYQYQVLLKPSPDNIQELYLESLAAIGIRGEEHDIRFVEDNWESPTSVSYTHLDVYKRQVAASITNWK